MFRTYLQRVSVCPFTVIVIGIVGVSIATVRGFQPLASGGTASILVDIGLVSLYVVFAGATALPYRTVTRLLGALVGVVALFGTLWVLLRTGWLVSTTWVGAADQAIAGIAVALALSSVAVGFTHSLQRLDRYLGLDSSPEERVLTPEEYSSFAFLDG